MAGIPSGGGQEQDGRDLRPFLLQQIYACDEISRMEPLSRAALSWCLRGMMGFYQSLIGLGEGKYQTLAQSSHLDPPNGEKN